MFSLDCSSFSSECYDKEAWNLGMSLWRQGQGGFNLSDIKFLDISLAKQNYYTRYESGQTGHGAELLNQNLIGIK